MQTTITCGGCARPKIDCVRMISGPNVYLCERCFEQAAQQLTPRRPASDAMRCRFCRQLRATSEVTAVGEVILCADCLGLMEVVLSKETA